MKYIPRLCLVAISILFLFACSVFLRASDSYLYVQYAPAAIIEPDKADQAVFYITLKNVQPVVTYFSDRPKRTAGTLGLKKFVEAWESNKDCGFKIDPPNADITGFFVRSEDRENIAVELLMANYNESQKSVTYKARILEGQTNDLKPQTLLHHITIFIDDACLSCW